MRGLTVESRKWNGGPHRRTPVVELGTDGSGTWLWVPDQTRVETATGFFAAVPGLRLIPWGPMWSAYFIPACPRLRRPKQLYVDITTPASRRGDVIEFIDLDLDVEQLDDGEVTILDGDEFEDHSDAWGYPSELVSAAEDACEWVVAAITTGMAPFDGSHGTWWDRLPQSNRFLS